MIPQQAMKNIDGIYKMVLAGMVVMYDKATRKILMSGLRNTSRPLPLRLAGETAGVMKMLDVKSPKGIPPDTVGPVAMLLLFELVTFIKQAGMAEPTEDDMRQAMDILKNILKELFGKQGKVAQHERAIGEMERSRAQQKAAAPKPAPAAPTQKAARTGLIGA